MRRIITVGYPSVVHKTITCKYDFKDKKGLKGVITTITGYEQRLI